MTTLKNGGPACAQAQAGYPSAHFGAHYSGMSIRTAFAGQILAGYRASPEWATKGSQTVASWAVMDAEALIAELLKDGGVL
jgi:trimethylamine:corrinoid methyltransferase-like protein